MTDRLNSFIVVLEQDIREDDAQETLIALRNIKGVLDVKPNTTEVNTIIYESRIKTKYRLKLFKALED